MRKPLAVVPVGMGPFYDPALQFVDEASRSSTALLVWCDLTKLGRVSNNDLNNAIDLISNALTKNPTKSVAFVLAPHLVSERVTNGLRGERRKHGFTKSFS